MAKSATQRDANRIKTLAQELLASAHEYLTESEDTKLEEIIKLSGNLDASTGRRDSSTKSRRSKAAKSGVSGRRETK